MISGAVAVVCIRLPARSRVGEPLALCEAQMPDDPAHHGIAHDAPQALIAVVVGAQHIAVHQQDALAIELDGRAVLEQPAAGVATEALAEQEVAVAVHDEAGHTSRGEIAQRSHDFALCRVRVIVTDPGFEQVAQDVEGICRVCVAGEELRGIAR